MSNETPRVIQCERTGRHFNYSGRGRPPKYHPDIRAAVQKEQRKASRQRAAKRRAELKEAA